MNGKFLSVLFFSVFLLICLTSLGQRKRENKPDTGIIVVDINVALTIDMKETSEYSICLHRGGRTIDSQFVQKAEVIPAEFHKNDIYTLSFHKDGYPDKYVVIDMRAPRGKAKQDYYEIAFEVELNPKHAMHKEEYKDHPVAIIKYDVKKDDWDFSTKYHEEIHHKEKNGRK